MGKKNRQAANAAFIPFYVFTVLFVLGPLVYMVILSFKTRSGFGSEAIFTLENYKNIFAPDVLKVFLQSIRLALLSTSLIILFGYPMGLAAAFLPEKQSKFFYSAQMLPYFVNSLLRLVGWIIIFRANGMLDTVLIALGITKEPLMLLYTYPAVVVGMVYALLPFMFMSVYQVAVKLDRNLIGAARDLGANSTKAFLTVILPLTLPGLKSGIVITFIPSMGLFFIAGILGGNKVILIGSLIEEQLMKVHNQPFAAALSVVLTLLTATVCGLLLNKKEEGQ